MKIAGKKLSGLNEEIVVLPRSGVDPETGELVTDLVFKFKPITDLEHFNKIYPEPKPTGFIIKPGEKESTPDFADPEYKKAVNKRNASLPLYLTIASILATPELEFERVDLDKPDTWQEFDKELFEAGLTRIEISLLYAAAIKVNSLDDTAIEQAKQRFLAGQRARTSKSL